jgi:outer membrane protein assembly factor BamE
MRKCLILVFTLGTVSCSYLQPYKIEIQQGNVTTQENVSKLKAGMTKPQVSFILGTPLLRDSFHANRWDYVYYLRKRGRIVEERRLAVIFENDRLKQIEGDVVRALEEAKAAPATGAAATATGASAAKGEPPARQATMEPARNQTPAATPDPPNGTREDREAAPDPSQPGTVPIPAPAVPSN